MKRKYEGVYVLNMQGQEEGLEEMVSSITKELESNGGSTKTKAY